MQTLAKYFVGLLLILFASLTQEEPVKEKVVEKCSQRSASEIAYLCEFNEDVENNI
jgi:hypothetical protein